jgi:cell division protein ZipA
MPQLRWTLLFLGVLFVILLAWIERRRQRRQGFSDHPTSVEKESGTESASAGPVVAFREPAFTLPEIRARDPGPPQELPVVEIDEDSLKARRLEDDAPRVEPPTLSLPVLDSGPVGPKARPAQPTLSGIESMKLAQTDEFARAVGDLNVPRLDRPAGAQAPRTPPVLHAARPSSSASPLKRINLADTDPGPDTDPRLVTRDSEERAFNEAVFGDPSVQANRREPHFSDEDAIAEGAIADGASAEGISADPDAAGAPTASPTTGHFTVSDITAPVQDPIVEWPPDDQRKVVALRLVAPPPERLAGRALRLALLSEGFVLGKFQIFHKPDANGRAVLSAASLSKPGTFDLDTMDVQRYGGLSLFAVLPGPRPPLKAFDDLLATARNLNERLQGALQDERGGPLTPTRIASLRESLAAETTT